MRGGRERSSKKKAFEEVPKKVMGGGVQTRSREEVLKEVMRGGSKEVAKRDVAKGRVTPHQEVARASRERMS